MRKFFCALLLLCFLPAVSAEAGIVLALSGGGTRGFAHVGVIEVLEEQNIPIVGIVGTSMGSLIGALKASGYSAAQIREIVEKLDLPSLMAENTGPMFVFTGDDSRAKKSTIPALSLKKTGKQHGPLGILKGDKLFQYFTQLMGHVKVTDFDALPIPYAAVATDINTGEKIVLRSGSLPSAMRASMSIPALFEPWQIEERLLVDGGLVSNLPVDTARKIFPGIPVLGVDVSSTPSDTRNIASFIDVVDQSLTIVMRKTTESEGRRADLLITPHVQGSGFLDASNSEAIIRAGRESTLARIDKIRVMSNIGPNIFVPLNSPVASNIVGDVKIKGITEKLALQLRKRYLSWVGKPLDTKSIEDSIDRLMDVDDIETVDYRLGRTDSGDILVIMDVRKSPDFEVGVSGYATNLHPYRWLYLKGTARGLLSESDSLFAVARIGKQWGIDLAYLTAPEPLNSWKINFAAHNWQMDTNNGYREWDRYSLGASHLFSAGDVRMGVGLAYEYISNKNGDDERSFGPTFFAAYDTLDIPGDPTTGHAWRLSMWWPELDNVLYRFTYFKPLQVGDNWRTYFRLGYAEGDMSTSGHAVYLGAAEELYSMASSPVEAERMAWVNVAFRRVLRRSVLGILAAEIFGSYGYAMDHDYKRIASPWEAGVAFNFPNNLIDAKLAAMYGSDGFKIGFFLGVPIWDHYPLP